MSDAVVSRIIVKFPEQIWIHAICKKYPGTSIEIQAFLPGTLENPERMIGNALMQIFSPNISHVVDDVKQHPSVVQLHTLAQDEGGALVNIQTHDRWLLASLIRAELVLRFPIRVRCDGEGASGTWVITGLRDKVDHLLRLLEEKKIDFKLQSIEKIAGDQVAGTLTPRQAEILEMALENGYFEIPRRISLTELAIKLGIAKSTLSGILRRISQKKMIA